MCSFDPTGARPSEVGSHETSSSAHSAAFDKGSPTAAAAVQLATETVKAAGHFGNTTAASNRYAQYVVLSAKGLNPDHYKTGGFCAWHDWNGNLGVSSSVGDVAFTNMPYTMDQGASCGQNFVNASTAGLTDG